MFIQLYSNKNLQKTKSYCLMFGAFLVIGGGSAFVREVVFSNNTNVVFAYGGVIFMLAGVVALAFATDKLPVKETFFSMTPERVSFRLSFFGKAHTLRWNNMSEVVITDHKIVFELKNGTEIELRFAAIQLPETAKHIRSSIRLAALEQNVKVNGVVAEHQRA